MLDLAFIFIILILAGVAWYYQREVMRLRREVVRCEGELEEKKRDAAEASSFEEYNERVREKKDERKEKIRVAFERNDTLKNSDVAELLGVSRNTAYNYLEELEQAGQVEQIGDAGRSVAYRKVK